jgi:hypothetical protein
MSITGYPLPPTVAAQNPKILAAAVNVTNSSLQDIYTVPAATAAVIRNLVLCNTNGNGPATISIFLRVAGAAQANKQLIRSQWTIPQNTTRTVNLDICLAATDKLSVIIEYPLGGAADMAITAFGEEWTTLQGVLPKVLGQLNLAANTNNDLYAVPAGKCAVITRIVVVNPNQANGVYTLLGNPASGTPVFYYLALSALINGVGAIDPPLVDAHVDWPGITLGAADNIGAQVPVGGAGANGLSFSCWGFEMAA